MGKAKEQMTEIDATIQDLLKASRELAETLNEIEAEKANFKEERAAHKEKITTLEERRDFLRDTVNSGKHKIPAQTSLIGDVTLPGPSINVPSEIEEELINIEDGESDRVQDAKVLIELIREKLTDLPLSAGEFVASIEVKITAILDEIEERESATDTQVELLEHLAEEVEQWGEPDAD
jgi:DNA repair exonuclease SbcCD ATPase subunit